MCIQDIEDDEDWEGMCARGISWSWLRNQGGTEDARRWEYQVAAVAWAGILLM